MKIVIYFVSMFLLACSHSTGGFAQTLNEDSLQRAILESLDRQLGKNKLLPNSFFDTSKIPTSSYMPIDLKKLFESINRDIAAARSAGDIENLSKGYGKLSSLDSIRGNYKGAYDNY